LYVSTPEFEVYEKGGMSDADFREFVKSFYRIDASDESLDACWNAMLLGFPRKEIRTFRNPEGKYNVYLLSNTNSIHLEHINNILLPRVNHHNLVGLFFPSRVLFPSHEEAKPDAEIFEQVLSEGKLHPSETLFLDDNQSNVEGAGKLGIKQCMLLTRIWSSIIFS
jgi:putative hydrolase of the HAD superfamily